MNTNNTDQGRLEHANLTVSDPERTAAVLSDLFGWHVRWKGPSLLGGHTIHVGNETDYLAIYTPPSSDDSGAGSDDSYHHIGGLNHIGVVVDDLDAAEERVIAAGFEPFNHGDYEPGRRFYFHDHDDIEFEVVSYR